MAFYIHLPSNSSRSFFPDNRPSRYRTKLPKRINLRVPYEVALSEVSYIHSLKQFPNTEDQKFKIITAKTEGSLLSSNFVTHEYLLETNHYGDIIQLVTNLRTVTRDANLFQYKEDRNRVKIVINSKVKQIILSRRIADVLGFKNSNLVFTKNTSSIVAENPPDLLYGQSRIFLYTNIIEEQIVGDTFCPLLSTIPFGDKERQAVIHTPKRSYLNVHQNEIDNILILFCNEYGEEISFDVGTSNVVLHFKPKSEQIF